jgi:hypothetical protein
MRKIMFVVSFIVLFFGVVYDAGAVTLDVKANFAYIFSNLKEGKDGTYFSGYSAYLNLTGEDIGSRRSLLLSGFGISVLNFEQVKSIKIPNGTELNRYTLSGGGGYLFFLETQWTYNILSSNSVIFTPLIGFYGQIGKLKRYERNEYDYLFKKEKKLGGSIGTSVGVGFGVVGTNFGFLLRGEYLYNLIGNIKGGNFRVGILLNWNIF